MIHRLYVLSLLVPVLSAQGASVYSIEKEEALGNQLAADFRRGAALPGNEALNAYLSGLGERIAAQAGGPAYPYTFELVDDTQIYLNEPIALPGGKIFVPSGLILAAASEDELAAMLAHSIAHIAARHAVSQGTRAHLGNQPAIPLIFMGGWQAFAMRQNQSLAIPQGFLAAYRQNELDADALGVRAMAAAGYNPAALAEYIARIQPPDAVPTPATKPYPDRDSRLAAIRASVATLPAAMYPTHAEFAVIQEQVKQLVAAPVKAKAPPRLSR